VHKEVIEAIANYALAQGIGILGLSFSPIKGPEGNIEYLIYLDKKQQGISREEANFLIEEIVGKSHEVL
jgi:23S rRNA (cytidine1920-2'-O)/16S rRNA (cytidine1409-2'-O)-methyltransferase